MENNIPNENKKGKSKKFYIVSIVVSLLLVAVIIGTSYAYFSASVDNSNNEVTVIKTGYMELEFTDGEVIGTTTDMIPGDTVQKKFKVRNTGNVTTPYDVYLSEVINTFATKSDLEYSLVTDDESFNKTNIQAPSTYEKIVDQRNIEPGEEQEYTITFKFKETGVNQDDNKGKRFAAKIAINEYQIANITINFNGNGGSVTTPSVQKQVGETVTLENPTREGYDFAGWYDEETGGSQVTNETIFNNDTTIYAHWSPVNYTITYNLNGGNATNPSTYTIETEDFTLNNPTKQGYNFVGWSGSNLSGNNNMTVTINKGTTGIKEYIANFEKEKYTVVFNANGGEGTMENQRIDIETATPLRKNTFTMSNHRLAGWDTSSSGTTVIYTDEQEVTDLASANETINLYAVWEPKADCTIEGYNGVYAVYDGPTGNMKECWVGKPNNGGTMCHGSSNGSWDYTCLEITSHSVYLPWYCDWSFDGSGTTNKMGGGLPSTYECP